MVTIVRFVMLLLLSAADLVSCSDVESGGRDDAPLASYEDATACKPVDAALFLQEEITYETSIKGIIADKCLGCHNVGGTGTPQLATYNDVKNNASVVLDSIKGGRMPPDQSQALIPIQVADLEAWINAGMKEKPDPDPNAPADPAATAAPDAAATPAPAGGTTTSTPRCLDNPDAYLAKGSVQKCQLESKVLFDRKANACGTIPVATTYVCDATGIIAAFSAAGYDIAGQLYAAIGDPSKAGDMGEGFKIDQCGEGPYVTLAKVVWVDGRPAVKMRELKAE